MGGPFVLRAELSNCSFRQLPHASSAVVRLVSAVFRLVSSYSSVLPCMRPKYARCMVLALSLHAAFTAHQDAVASGARVPKYVILIWAWHLCAKFWFILIGFHGFNF